MTSQRAEGRAGYNARTGAYHVRHDWGGEESLAELVVFTVAAIVGVEPEHVAPLSSCVDTDSLESLFSLEGDPTGGGHLSFRLNDCTVTVYNDGDVLIRPPESGL